MRKKSIACILASLLLLTEAGCAHAKGVQAVLGVDDIVRSAKTLKGKRVAVRGFLRFGTDSRNLWANKEAYSFVESHVLLPNDPAWGRCITLFDVGNWRNLLRQKNNSYVTIYGIVESYASGQGEIIGECSELGISVQSVTAR